VVRALLGALDPTVIIGTIWPDRYTAYTTVPTPGDSDPHAREREVLDLAAVIRIGTAFSSAEQTRARAATARDRRLAVALESAGYGLTQTLAAAPQLVARWEDAQTASPYAWAVLTAALDVVRLGARAPLSVGLLRASAPGYCTGQQQAEAPDNWFEQALAYTTGKLHGAAAALSPAGAGMGQIAGYAVADYLVQHAIRERRYARVPSSTWEATLSHVRDPADAARLATSASNRLLYCFAIPLYRHAADAGDKSAARRLAILLARRGDLDEAVQILRALADVGDESAAYWLAALVADRGELGELRALAHAGDKSAARRLASLLGRRGDLLDDDDLDELRALAHAGDHYAAGQLEALLGKRGELDDDLDDLYAQSAELDDDDLDELRTRVDAGDGSAAYWLAALLVRRGELDELRTRADAGDGFAAYWLAALLVRRGELDELRTRVDAGDGSAARHLPGLLIRQGRREEAERLRRFGLNLDGSITDK
jgi:hypothetical protein